jgi:hypothetical protein
MGMALLVNDIDADPFVGVDASHSGSGGQPSIHGCCTSCATSIKAILDRQV